MIKVPALFARLFAGFLTLSILVCAARADTVIQVNLNGYTTGIFGDQISSYQIELYNAEAPLTVSNYLSYANSGAYNGSIFHRDVPGFHPSGRRIQPAGQQQQPRYRHKRNHCRARFRTNTMPTRSNLTRHNRHGEDEQRSGHRNQPMVH